MYLVNNFLFFCVCLSVHWPFTWRNSLNRNRTHSCVHTEPHSDMLIYSLAHSLPSHRGDRIIRRFKTTRFCLLVLRLTMRKEYAKKCHTISIISIQVFIIRIIRNSMTNNNLPILKCTLNSMGGRITMIWWQGLRIRIWMLKLIQKHDGTKMRIARY